MSQTYANPDVHVVQGWACGDGQAVLPEPSWDNRVNDAKNDRALYKTISSTVHGTVRDSFMDKPM